jgi:hypothetical protein
MATSHHPFVGLGRRCLAHLRPHKLTDEDVRAAIACTVFLFVPGVAIGLIAATMSFLAFLSSKD